MTRENLTGSFLSVLGCIYSICTGCLIEHGNLHNKMAVLYSSRHHRKFIWGLACHGNPSRLSDGGKIPLTNPKPKQHQETVSSPSSVESEDPILSDGDGVKERDQKVIA